MEKSIPATIEGIFRVRDDCRRIVAGTVNGNCEDEDCTLEISDSITGSTGTRSIFDSGGGKLPCKT